MTKRRCLKQLADVKDTRQLNFGCIFHTIKRGHSQNDQKFDLVRSKEFAETFMVIAMGLLRVAKGLLV